MTAKVYIRNDAPKGGPLLEVTVYTRAATGVTSDNAKDFGITRKLVPIEGVWAVLMTNYRLLPGDDVEVWVHDLQFFLTREVEQ